MRELQVSNVLWRQYHSGKILASRCGQNQQTVTAGNILGLTLLITVRKANENRVSAGLNMMSACGLALRGQRKRCSRQECLVRNSNYLG